MQVKTDNRVILKACAQYDNGLYSKTKRVKELKVFHPSLYVVNMINRNAR